MKKDAGLWIRLVKCYGLVMREVRGLPSASGLTLPQFDVLTQLLRHPGGMTAGHVSREMLVTAGNLTGIINRLRERKLITLEGRADDRRIKLLRLTSAGRRIARREVARHEKKLQELLSGLSRKGKDSLRASLDELRDAIEKGQENGDRTEKLSLRA